MQFLHNKPKTAKRDGFTMVELLAAIVVFNLMIVGLVKLFIGQNSMVEDLEGWAEGEPVWYIEQEADPMARALGIPASLSEKRNKSNKVVDPSSTPYFVEVLNVERFAASNSASVVFQQVKVDDEEDKDKDKDKDKNEGKKGKDGRGDKDDKDDGKEKGKEKGKKGKKGRGKR